MPSKEVWKLINKLRNSQFDRSLSIRQRKLARELYSKTLYMEEYPEVSADLINCVLEMIMNVKEEGE